MKVAGKVPQSKSHRPNVRAFGDPEAVLGRAAVLDALWSTTGAMPWGAPTTGDGPKKAVKN